MMVMHLERDEDEGFSSAFFLILEGANMYQLFGVCACVHAWYPLTSS